VTTTRFDSIRPRPCTSINASKTIARAALYNENTTTKNTKRRENGKCTYPDHAQSKGGKQQLPLSLLVCLFFCLFFVCLARNAVVMVLCVVSGEIMHMKNRVE